MLISGIPADRVADDIIERKLYSRDLAQVPAVITRPFFRTLPDVVVRPADAEQVGSAIRQAHDHRLPITPRAAASTSYFNAVPVRGGLVLDLNDLRGMVELDRDKQIARVLPGTTWCDLEDSLRLQGFAAKSYPSSAVAATVGGWVSTQGYGIGSLRYGALRDQLIRLQVVLPDGELCTVGHDTDPPLDWFVAAEGTLGVVTEVELTVRHSPDVESHHLFAFNDLSSLGQSILTLARSEPRPFTVSFADEGYLNLLASAGFATPLDREVSTTLPPSGEGIRSDLPTSTSSPQATSWGWYPYRSQPLVGKGLAAGAAQAMLLVSFQGKPADVERGKESLLILPGRELTSELALEEWNLLLFHLRAKRGGPSLLAAEQLLPLDKLPGYLEATKRITLRHQLPIGSYGLAATPELALVTSIYPTDERRTIEYLGAIGFTKRLHDLGARFGGLPYGVGLWNSAYLARLFSQSRLDELRLRKALLDPRGIMNPGKLYRSSFPLWPIVFGPGAEILASAFLALRRRRQ